MKNFFEKKEGTQYRYNYMNALSPWVQSHWMILITYEKEHWHSSNFGWLTMTSMSDIAMSSWGGSEVIRNFPRRFWKFIRLSNLNSSSFFFDRINSITNVAMPKIIVTLISMSTVPLLGIVDKLKFSWLKKEICLHNWSKPLILQYSSSSQEIFFLYY